MKFEFFKKDISLKITLTNESSTTCHSAMLINEDVESLFLWSTKNNNDN